MENGVSKQRLAQIRWSLKGRITALSSFINNLVDNQYLTEAERELLREAKEKTDRIVKDFSLGNQLKGLKK